MRYILLLVMISVALGCSSKAPRADAPEIITRHGVIVGKEAVEMEEARQNSRTSTSVYGSVSSGGRVSIGIGVLFSQLFTGGGSKDQPVRYEVRLTDGGEMTIYHDSRDFEIDDCVEIRVYPDEKKNPPTMKRKPGACQ